MNKLSNKETLKLLGIWLACMLVVCSVVIVSYIYIGPLTFCWMLPLAFGGLWWQIKNGMM